MNNKTILNKSRLLLQIVMAIAFIGLLIAAWRWPVLGYFIPLCMVLGIGLALFKGRKWCDWYCPRGSFFDTLAKVIKSRNISPLFKGLPMRIGVLAFLMLMMASQIIRHWPDPYKIGAFFVTMLTVTTIIGLILILVSHSRAWCTVCPIGSISSWVGNKKYPLYLDSDKCTECQLCHQACPVQIKPHSFKNQAIEIVQDGDCLKCGLWVDTCHKKALSFRKDVL